LRCLVQLNHERQRFAFAVGRHSLSKPFKYFAKLIARRRRTEIPYDPYCVTLFEYRSDLAEVGVEHRLETGNVCLASSVIDSEHWPNAVNDDNLRLAPPPI